MLDINAENEDKTSERVSIDKLPDECPICHKKITPQYKQAFLSNKKDVRNILQVIFRCPNEECGSIFIGFYLRKNGYRFYFKRLEPYRPVFIKFSVITEAVSPNFILIYNQAYIAEQAGLKVICGAGYRKALEFLIKDYLISKITKRVEKEEIKKEFLSTVIEKKVDYVQLKTVAKRATWLGNDESHYERRWQNKDLTDLKKLINLTICWIEADKLTEDLIKDMPAHKK